VKGSFDQRLLIRSIRYALERQQSEEELRHSESTVRSIFENSPDALLILAEDETCKSANSAAAALLGVPQPEMEGRSIAAFIESDSREKWESVRASRNGRGTFWVVRQDQTYRFVDCCFSANIVPGSHLCALRDITEQHSLEQQLRLSQKMDAVGRLAAGLAHDFNNILGVISGCAELMQMKANDASLIAKTGKILAATQKAATLTRQLLALGCRQFIAPTLLDVSAVLAGIDSVVTCLTGAKIQVTVQTGEQPGLIKADPGQMEQVILNLVSNAADAMPNGGTLAIRVENHKTSGADPQLPAGDYVLVAVSDTGVGMEEKLQSLIFEPFFSTKKNGSGLGLSTVYGIVKQAGGHITVQSAPNEGSTFRLFFPVASATESESLQEEPPPTAPVKRKETILVADDEDELRNSVGEYLETCGYCVLQARDGEEAITILDSHAEPIAAVITDLVMPKVDGRGLIDHVRKKHPETGILVISGYAGDAAVRHGFFIESTFFLQKPFALDSLDSKIRNLLDRTA
jgi:PAS domain S-box-containing protein